MPFRPRRFVPSIALAFVMALAVAAPAAATYVSGQQKVVNEKAGKFKMNGGLRGSWKITAFKVTHTKPVFHAKGKEKFKGCLDVAEDRSCKGDPSGVLRFRFRYWGSFDENDGIQLGTCAHPVIKGKRDFAGATGFLMMVDRPKKSQPFVKTHYEGVIDLAGSVGRAAGLDASSSC